MKLFIYLLLFFLVACGAVNEDGDPTVEERIESTSSEEINEEIVLEANNLDSILGDKIINAATGEIRNHNFESFKNITVSDLNKGSLLYDITPINENNYLLKQKKTYSEARLFNAILKTEHDTVIAYYILNDYSINDIKMDGDSFLILSDDWLNENYYWQRKLEAKIIKLDLDFNPLWEYQASYQNPLETVSIKSGEHFDTYTINVITGCHICYCIVELRLSKAGEFIAVEEVSLHNSESMAPDALIQIFSK